MQLILAIIGHLVGDYLLQNDWMALNKKRNPLICFVHAILWTASVCFFAAWSNPWAIGVLLLTHFIQDHSDVVILWMRMIGQKQFATGPCSPWSIIVVDNVWHIVTIWAVWKFLV